MSGASLFFFEDLVVAQFLGHFTKLGDFERVIGKTNVHNTYYRAYCVCQELYKVEPEVFLFLSRSLHFCYY